jgi:ubiquinone/menaquinone biosynthesis C-methylase UbiE
MNEVMNDDVSMNDVIETWSQVAAAWDRNADFVERIKAPVTDRLLELLQLRPGDRVLELGAGPGALGARLAALVGPDGRVIVSDIATGMVEAAKQRLAGVPGVEVLQLDASATGLPAESQDAVVIRMGLMLVPDPVSATTEIHRLLVDGGRAGIVVWAAPEHNPWMTSLGMAAMIHGLVAGGPPTGAGGVFSLGDADVLAKTVETAGFASVDVEQIAVTVPFPDLDAYVAYITSMAGPLAQALAAASDDQLAAVRSTVAELAARFRHEDGGYGLPGLAHLAVATR